MTEKNSFMTNAFCYYLKSTRLPSGIQNFALCGYERPNHC